MRRNMKMPEMGQRSMIDGFFEGTRSVGAKYAKSSDGMKVK